MESRVYKGVIREDDYLESYEALFIGASEYPIAEIFEDDFEGKNVTIRYWISDREKSKEDMQENALRHIMGDVSAEYSDRFSEITGYLWTDQNLQVGGHDLLKEIKNHLGKFIYLEVEIHS